MIGDTPDDLVRRYPGAFGMVVSELAGPTEVQQRMHASREDFLQLLGDSRKAGQFAAQVLDGLDWDWPRWHDYVKTSMYANDTLPDLRQQALRMKPSDGLDMMTGAQLKAVIKQHRATLPGRPQRSELVTAVKALPAGAWAPEAKAHIQLWLNKKEQACRQKMGVRIASRIAHIALEVLRLKQRSDPGYLALRPNWEFVCGDKDQAPKSCRKLHGKVLPAPQAMNTFPGLPCDRLDCQCRIEARGK